MLDPGKKAPDFELPDQNGNLIKLSDVLDRALVLFFYPRANTSGCTTQACGVRDRKADYAAAGATVIGISPDEVKDIDKFAGKHDLDFTLLADADHAVAEKYGTWVEKSMYGRKYMGVERSTFLIDRQGRIARSWRKVKVPGHAEEVLAAARELGK